MKMSIFSKRSIKYIFLTIFAAFILISCSKEDNGEPYIPIDEISATETVLFPDSESKTVSTTLKFKNFEDVDYLLVTMPSSSVYSEKIDKSELSPTYLFKYTLRQNDPESFTLILRVVYLDGNVSRDLYLNVEYKKGFNIRSISRIARVTGVPIAGETFHNPNNTALDWNVGGTDLGIIWEMEPGNYGIFFGDTFGRDFRPNTQNPGPNGSDWRNNVLAFSDDSNLEDGLRISSMVEDANGNAKEIIHSPKTATDITSIPTAAIRANGADYVHYFNMRDWNTWTTNYSGMYKSTDNGNNWTKLDHVNFTSNSPFGQAGYFKKDGYVYMIGTQTGRSSKASLARFREVDIENRNQYEYWNGQTKTWSKGNEYAATVIIDDEVGELSFIYNSKLDLWIIAYFNGPRYNISMRTAKDITGPWSEPYEIASGWEYAQLYGSYFHPLSADSETLYFTMSMWLPYNVYLMKVVVANIR